MPQVGGCFVTVPGLQKPFEVTFEVSEVVTRKYVGTIWAENLDDAEALAENEYQDGHIFNEYYEKEFTVTERTLEGVSFRRVKE